MVNVSSNHNGIVVFNKVEKVFPEFIDLIKIGYKSNFKPKPQNFKKEALFYFHSCPKLCDLIKNNKIGRHSFKKIAEIYDKECGDS